MSDIRTARCTCGCRFVGASGNRKMHHCASNGCHQTFSTYLGLLHHQGVAVDGSKVCLDPGSLPFAHYESVQKEHEGQTLTVWHRVEVEA